MRRKESLLQAYTILRVSLSADDKTIRDAYLALIKQNPPERNPDEFQKIVKAYQEIKDEKSRLEYYLFDKEIPIQSPKEALFFAAQHNQQRKPPSFEKLKEFLKNG